LEEAIVASFIVVSTTIKAREVKLEEGLATTTCVFVKAGIDVDRYIYVFSDLVGYDH
jgi:hypothetical protein